ncbi:MAG TPA: phosphatase PAP2 family protein [Candidatus Kapabacteria bacterium]|jgi:membrane-associated phospholipid phosphatase
MEPEVFIQAKVSKAPRSLPLSRRLAKEIAPHEVFLLVCSLVFSIFAIFASFRIPEWPFVLLDMAVAAGVVFGINLWTTLNSSQEIGIWLRRARLLYLFPVIPIYFEAMGLIAFPLHGHDFDSILIATDRLIFGVNPTQWLWQHFPTWPWLTEYLMICYSLFYFLPLVLVIDLYLQCRKNNKEWSWSFRDISREEPSSSVEQVVFIIVYGFLLSYIGYLLIPSIGPRFTLHNFFDLSKELPGLWLTEPLRNILNRGENILPGMSINEVLRGVNRDAFPSGHTDITALTIILAFQFRSRFRWPILIIGTSLIFSTIYLRYHYVIDIIGGLVFAAITLYTWQWLRDRMLILRARFS